MFYGEFGRYTRDRLTMVPMFVAALSAGCTLEALPKDPSAVYPRHLPPTAADVMEAAIRSRDVDDTVDSSCGNFGHWYDRTMSRHLANMIAWSERGEVNWVEVRIAPRRAPSGMYWRAMVLFRIDTEGPDPYSGGADFLIRQSDGLVIPGSFKCPGL